MATSKHFVITVVFEIEDLYVNKNPNSVLNPHKAVETFNVWRDTDAYRTRNQPDQVEKTFARTSLAIDEALIRFKKLGKRAAVRFTVSVGTYDWDNENFRDANSKVNTFWVDKRYASDELATIRTTCANVPYSQAPDGTMHGRDNFKMGAEFNKTFAGVKAAFLKRIRPQLEEMYVDKVEALA